MVIDFKILDVQILNSEILAQNELVVFRSTDAAGVFDKLEKAHKALLANKSKPIHLRDLNYRSLKQRNEYRECITRVINIILSV